MGRSRLVQKKRQDKKLELIWRCLRRNSQYIRDCSTLYKKGRRRIPTPLMAFVPHPYFVRKYGISYPISPQCEFSGPYKNLIRRLLIQPFRKVEDLTFPGLEEDHPGEEIHLITRKIKKERFIVLKIHLDSKKQTLLGQVGDVLDRYQKLVRPLEPTTFEKGATLMADERRIRAYELYMKPKSYAEVARKMAKETIQGEKPFTETYVKSYPQAARRDVMRWVEEAEELIKGGYKKMR